MDCRLFLDGQETSIVFNMFFFFFFHPPPTATTPPPSPSAPPPLSFDVIVDTGSTMTYVPCARCGRACGPHHQAGFSVDTSSTARTVRCATPACACGSTPCGCTPDGVCTFEREYAEQSTAAGVVVSDVVWLPPSDGAGGSVANAASSASTPPRITLGCTTKETGEIHAQRAAGVAGLGNATTGLVAQLAAGGAIDTAAFALCLAPDPDPGAANHHGVLVLGGGAVRGAPKAALRGPVARTRLAASRGHPAHYALPVASMALTTPREEDGGGGPLAVRRHRPRHRLAVGRGRGRRHRLWVDVFVPPARGRVRAAVRGRRRRRGRGVRHRPVPRPRLWRPLLAGGGG